MRILFRILFFVAFWLVAICGAPAAELDIRDHDGEVIIPADKIKSYDWATHTITLQPGAKPALANDPLLAGQKLVSGVPFSVCLDGKAIYGGVFTTSASSRSFSTPVIVYLPIAYDATILKDGIRIQLGYPTEEFFKGDDPRNDKRIKDALRAAGKLDPPCEDHAEWVAKVLREIHTLKPGMTREDLLKIFTEEGGLSTRFQRRYVHRECPYIKVDVKFDDTGLEANGPEQPQDKITQVSTPFLEWTIVD
jgi:hypothetical protein